MTLAERYRWTPAEVDALDPDFVEELMLFLRADREKRKQEEREQRRKR